MLPNRNKKKYFNTKSVYDYYYFIYIWLILTVHRVYVNNWMLIIIHLLQEEHQECKAGSVSCEIKPFPQAWASWIIPSSWSLGFQVTACRHYIMHVSKFLQLRSPKSPSRTWSPWSRYIINSASWAIKINIYFNAIWITFHLDKTEAPKGPKFKSKWEPAYPKYSSVRSFIQKCSWKLIG